MKEFTVEHQVEYYECDFCGRLKTSTILALFISVATQHNDQLKVGTAVAKGLGGGWIILGYDGQFLRPRPMDNDLITVGTSLVAYNRFFVIRQFTLRDHEGHLPASFRGQFAFIDLAKRRLMAIPAMIYRPFQQSASKHLPRLTAPVKVTSTAGWQERDYRACLFDVDFNGHVGNTHYLDWMLDPLGKVFLAHHRLTNLVVRYDREIQAGVTVHSLVHPTGNASQHRIQVAGQNCARADMKWQESQDN